MQPAFAVFDKDNSGVLDGEEFKRALPLMGEDVPEEEIEKMFNAVDCDGSGRIEFGEFMTLVRQMNPKEHGEKEGGFSLSSVSLPEIPKMPEMPKMPKIPDMPDMPVNPMRQEEEVKGGEEGSQVGEEEEMEAAPFPAQTQFGSISDGEGLLPQGEEMVGEDVSAEGVYGEEEMPSELHDLENDVGMVEFGTQQGQPESLAHPFDEQLETHTSVVGESARDAGGGSDDGGELSLKEIFAKKAEDKKRAEKLEVVLACIYTVESPTLTST